MLAATGYDITIIESTTTESPELEPHLRTPRTRRRLRTSHPRGGGCPHHGSARRRDRRRRGQPRHQPARQTPIRRPRVVARVNDTDNAWLFDSRWGVDVAVPAATPLISLIEEATGATDTVALLRLSKAGVNVIETAITPHSRAVGHTLADITLPSGTVIAAVIRNGEPTVPGPQFQLQPGDELLVVSEAATGQDIDAAFQ